MLLKQMLLLSTHRTEASSGPIIPTHKARFQIREEP